MLRDPATPILAMQPPGCMASHGKRDRHPQESVVVAVHSRESPSVCRVYHRRSSGSRVDQHVAAPVCDVTDG